ncbi:MAG: peptide deformylase [Synergistaceae bacterium]|jgi:peptide deformylase|nr:peptide deformylase [Synergistaceae bacterium]
MAILDILIYPDPALRVQCRDVTEFDDKLKKLLQDMFETMYSAKGVGLAAPQVGVPLKLFVAEWEGGRHVLANPEIIEAEGSERTDEGCLSFPGIYEEVARPNKIRILYHDENGRRHDEVVEGFLARVFAHETDHLNARLLIDHLSALKRTFLRKRMGKKARSA